MSNFNRNAWISYQTPEGKFVILSEGDTPDNFKLIAQINDEELDNPEEIARLIAGAPEMHVALLAVYDFLRTTRNFFVSNGLFLDGLYDNLAAIAGILDYVDGCVPDDYDDDEVQPQVQHP